jgi:hypothetical protein
MGLKRFEEYAKEFDLIKSNSDYVFKKIKTESNINKKEVIEKTKIKNLKVVNKVNENSFLVGTDYKVKIVVDVPQNLVQEYINKVKEETDKNPLDNFSESEIAEQIVMFIIKNNLVIDNLTSEFTVGSENIASTEQTKSNIKKDAEKLSDDLGVGDSIDSESDSDGEIEFNDFNETDTSVESENKETIGENDSFDSEIEFEDSREEKDLGEERTTDNAKPKNDTESDFDEIEFVDGDESESESKPKTIGDLKTMQGKSVENKHKKETPHKPAEEEEEIEDMYQKMGYKVGYYEKLNLNTLKKY